jgi:hypothetical protein
MRINPLPLCFLLLFCFNYTKAQQQTTALVGATIIDVSNYGNNTNDLNDAVVIFQNGKIKQVGSKKTIKIAAGTKVIDVTGKFILPGLIDGFSTLNNQGQANAHLYMGVTTISGGIPGDRRRGDFFIHASPSPRLKRIAAVPNDADKYGLYEKAKASPEDISGISQELDQLNIQNKFAILSLISNPDYLKIFSTDQLQSQVSLYLNQYESGILIVSIFWGLWLFPFGYLVFKSGFLPKILGILLMLGCLGYLVNFVGHSLVSNYSKIGVSSYISLPASLGEIGTCLWLLIMGAKDNLTTQTPATNKGIATSVS